MEGGIWSRDLRSTAPLRSRIFSSARTAGVQSAGSILAVIGEVEGRHPSRLDSEQSSLASSPASLSFPSAYSRLPSAAGSCCFCFTLPYGDSFIFYVCFFSYWDTIHIKFTM